MSYFQRRFYSINLGREFSPAVKYLLLSNLVIFVFYNLFGDSLRNTMNYWLALSQYSIVHKFHLWKFVTYLFLHDGFWHILFNMLVLWMFGTDVELYMGTRTFVKFYLFCGIGGGIAHIFFFANPVVGASGAIYGLLVAFGILFAERVITLLIFFIIPVQMKAKYLILIVFGGSLLMLVFSGSGSEIAHLAHLGGAVCGLIYFYIPGNFHRLSEILQEKKTIQQEKRQRRREQNLWRIREEIDLILDKINEVGYDNITDEEKKLLTEYSKLLSDNEIL